MSLLSTPLGTPRLPLDVTDPTAPPPPPPPPGDWDPYAIKVTDLSHSLGLTQSGGQEATVAARTNCPIWYRGIYEGHGPFQNEPDLAGALAKVKSNPNVVCVIATHIWPTGGPGRDNGQPTFHDPLVDIVHLENLANGGYNQRFRDLGSWIGTHFTLDEFKRTRWRGAGLSHEHNGSFHRTGPPLNFTLPANVALSNRFMAADAEIINLFRSQVTLGLPANYRPWFRTELCHFGEGVATAAGQDWCDGLLDLLDPGALSVIGFDKYATYSNEQPGNNVGQWSAAFAWLKTHARAMGIPVAFGEVGIKVKWNVATDFDGGGEAFVNQMRTDLAAEMVRADSGLAWCNMFETDRGAPTVPGGLGTGERISTRAILPPAQRFPGVTSPGGLNRLTLKATTNGVTYDSNWPRTAAAFAAFGA